MKVDTLGFIDRLLLLQALLQPRQIPHVYEIIVCDYSNVYDIICFAN
jgi:hypothetical protein